MVRCQTKRLLLRWTGWFFFINTLFSIGIQMTYLKFLTDLHVIVGSSAGNRVLAWSFLIASYIAHAALLNYGVALIPLVIAFIFPRKRLIFPTAFVLAAILIIGELVDRISFSIFHTHALGEVWTIFKTNSLAQVIPLSNLELSLLILIILLVILVESGIGFLVLRVITNRPGNNKGYYVSAFLGTMIAFSYGLMASVVSVPTEYQTSADKSRLILRMARLVPYYRDLYNVLLPTDNQYLLNIKSPNGNIPLLLQSPSEAVNYPRHKLTFHPITKPKNIVFIVIDTWRFDTLTQKITPNIWKLAQKSVQFENHWSGGNCTKTGIFTLFYGIPSNYWNPMLASGKSPVFLNELQNRHYQMSILGSATLRFPQFEKTVFLNIPNSYETTSSSTVNRDKEITQHFLQFINKRKTKQPFFSFIFYDAVHNYCEGSDKQHQSPFKPAVKDCARYALTLDTNPEPYLNRYYNAAHFVDHQVQQVISALKQKHLLENTIIVVTADHGEEFNDEHLGYWSHGTAYTPFQLHVPLIIYWPGKKPQTLNYKTTHFDIAPTLMQEELGSTNPMSDYSMGHSLFQSGNRAFFIAGSYDDYAVVTQQQVTRIYPGGDYVINHANGWNIPLALLNRNLMLYSYKELMRFYKKENDWSPK